MAFDPAHEDYFRLAISQRGSEASSDPYSLSRRASAFYQQFSWGNDALATTDVDRAFHLMSEAAEIIDDELPFLSYEEGAARALEARELLDEAISLDAECHDAQRLIHAQESRSMEDHLQFLARGLESVRRVSLRRAERARGLGGEAGRLGAELALAPYQRWLQSLAELSLLGGRYRVALDYVRRNVELDATDPADARYTGYLAFAKLDDGAALEEFARSMAEGLGERRSADPWLVIARAAIAWKAGNDATAHERIASLVATHPLAGTTLSRLAEVPEPMFARLPVQRGSEEELAIAVSEAAVLFQESADESGLGPFGHFVADDPAVQAAYQRERELFGNGEDEGDDAAPWDGAAEGSTR